jgi:hypothetical protein
MIMNIVQVEMTEEDIRLGNRGRKANRVNTPAKKPSRISPPFTKSTPLSPR